MIATATAITGGNVLTGGTLAPLDLAIGADGRVLALGGRGAFAGAGATLDATGLLVLPGAIDSHFHVRAPSRPDRETFATATRAVAAGGTTTLIEMPIAEPPTTDGASLRLRAALAAQETVIDVAFYASCAADMGAMASAAAGGAVAFKAFLQRVPPGRESEFDGLCLPTTADLAQAFERARAFDLPCAFHAEDEPIYAMREAHLRAAGRTDGPAHADARPDYVEAVSVGTLLALAASFGVHVHVPHVSSALTAALIREAKARGVPVTAETCPQYLAFDRTALAQVGPYAKCNPPLKEAHDREAVWEAVRDGTIDTLASDHAPFTVAEKEAARENIWLAPPGMPGGELLLSWAVGEALEGRLTWRRFEELLVTNPARIFGLAGKGAIAPGVDADLVLYDPADRGTFALAEFRSRAGGTGVLWDGFPRIGRVCRTLLRGQTVFDGESVIAAPGSGRVVGHTTDEE